MPTVADWITYAAARGTVVPDDAASAAALVRATDYITYNYISRFAAGYDATSPNVDEAIYEAATLELATPNLFSTTFTPDQQKVLTKVGELSWTATGKAGGADGATPVSIKIEAMLRPYKNYLTGVMVV